MFSNYINLSKVPADLHEEWDNFVCPALKAVKQSAVLVHTLEDTEVGRFAEPLAQIERVLEIGFIFNLYEVGALACDLVKHVFVVLKSKEIDLPAEAAHDTDYLSTAASVMGNSFKVLSFTNKVSGFVMDNPIPGADFLLSFASVLHVVGVATKFRALQELRSFEKEEDVDLSDERWSKFASKKVSQYLTAVDARKTELEGVRRFVQRGGGTVPETVKDSEAIAKRVHGIMNQRKGLLIAQIAVSTISFTAIALTAASVGGVVLPVALATVGTTGKFGTILFENLVVNRTLEVNEGYNPSSGESGTKDQFVVS